jgi:exodeoxyribonuclease VII large subunit
LYFRPALQQLNLNITEKPVLTVAALARQIQQTVESTFGRVRVRGEISGYKLHTSGHGYFTLKDDQAVIDAVCWRGTRLDVRLEEGLEIIASGRVTTYPGRSKYQLIIEKAEVAGQGALLKLLMERKAKLEGEGLFARKRPIPPFPRRIGVVTSPTGAVIQDILHRISERFPTHVMVWPVAVQGDTAAAQIAQAIAGFNTLDIKPDVIIVARGGGSLEDLWAFNEEAVVRAAAGSAIPLISAVGHETDVTLIDFAADLRAPTPTAAAELATPVLRQLVIAVEEHERKLKNQARRILENLHLHVKALGGRIPEPKNILDHAAMRTDDWVERLRNSFAFWFAAMQQKTLNLSTHIKAPHNLIDQSSRAFEQLRSRFSQSASTYYDKTRMQFDNVVNRLEQSSYPKVLQRGFCMITDGAKPLTSVYHIHATQPMDLHFHDGNAQGHFTLNTLQGTQKT